MTPVATAPPAPLAIEVRGIERRFGRLRALAGVDLDVPQGQTLALLGANGAGKSTLLNILARVLRPTAGTIRILGHDPRRELEAVLRDLGYVAHAVGLYLDLTAVENVAFTARLHGLADPDGLAHRALAQVGLDRDGPVRGLSRGLQQRAALARALVHQPRLILLDEPWTGLDRAAQAVLGERLAAHRGVGGTTIFTTHDLRIGYDSADRVVVLDRGRVVIDALRANLAFADLEATFAARAPAALR